MNIIIIAILGSNIYNILQDRLMTAISYIEQNYENKIQVDWFLSGGKKSSSYDIDESVIMYNYITKIEQKYLDKIKFNYIFDSESTNTAQNLFALSYYLNKTSINYNEINIITSDFHYNRANNILQKIDNSREYNWILGLEEQHNSRYWENIHLQNIEQDISKLFN